MAPKKELTVIAPDAPAYLPEKQQEEWQKRFSEAFSEAEKDYPGDEQTQRIAALKEANKLLRVPAPSSAEEINKMPEHHVVKRGRKTVGGVEHVFAVTSDGHKYSFQAKK